MVVSMCRRCIVMRWTCRLFVCGLTSGGGGGRGRKGKVRGGALCQDFDAGGHGRLVCFVSSQREEGRWSGACFGSTRFVSRWGSWKGGNRPRRGNRFVLRGQSPSWYQGAYRTEHGWLSPTLTRLKRHYSGESRNHDLRNRTGHIEGRSQGSPPEQRRLTDDIQPLHPAYTHLHSLAPDIASYLHPHLHKTKTDTRKQTR